MSLGAWLDINVKIRRPLYGKSDIGAATRRRWQTIHVSTPARKRVLQSSERAFSGRDGEVTTHRFYFGADINPLKMQDCLTVIGDDTEHDVVSINPVKAGNTLHHYEVDTHYRK